MLVAAVLVALAVGSCGGAASNASPTVVEGSGTFEYAAGSSRGEGRGADCVIGANDSYLQVGQAADEPTISVGRTSVTPSGVEKLAGGGTFSGSDVELRFYFSKEGYDRATDATIELAPDLRSGTFSGSLGGDALTGSFDCDDPMPTPMTATDVARASIEDAFGNRVEVTVERLELHEDLLDRSSLRLLVTYRVVSAELFVIVGDQDWIVTGAGTEVRADPFPNASPALEHGSLDAGDTLSGWLEFDVPTGQNVEVAFSPDENPEFTIWVSGTGAVTTEYP